MLPVLLLFVCALLPEFVIVYELALLTFRGHYSVQLPYPTQPTLPMTIFPQPNLFPANTISAAIPANAVQPPEDSRPRLLDGPVIAGLEYSVEDNRTRNPMDGPASAGLRYSPEGSRPHNLSNGGDLVSGFGNLSVSNERFPGYNPNQEKEQEDGNH